MTPIRRLPHVGIFIIPTQRQRDGGIIGVVEDAGKINDKNPTYRGCVGHPLQFRHSQIAPDDFGPLGHKSG